MTMNSSKKKRKICFAIPHSFVLRNFLYSGLADKLSNDLYVDVEFLSPNDVDILTSPSNTKFKNHYIKLSKSFDPDEFPNWPRLLMRIRRWIYALEVDNSGIVQDRIRKKIYGNNVFRKSIVSIFVQLIKVILPRSGKLRNLIRYIIDYFGVLVIRPYPPFEKRRYDLLIVGSPGLNSFDWFFIWQARKIDIPTICIMNSWDNMITKGSIMARVDRILVWNTEMQEHARRLHGLNSNVVKPIGALQFAFYDNSINRNSAIQILSELNVESEKFILYLGSQRAPEYEIEDILELKKILKRSNLFRKTKIIVRPHPQGMIEKYSEILKEKVIFDKPPLWAISGNDGLNFDQIAMQRMKVLLENALVVTASWGTTGLLEAAILDKPIIQLRWMKSVKHSIPKQVADMKIMQNYAHLESFDKSNAKIYSYSPDDFQENLSILLRHSNIYRNYRRRAASLLVVYPLSEVTDRITGDCSLFLNKKYGYVV